LATPKPSPLPPPRLLPRLPRNNWHIIIAGLKRQECFSWRFLYAEKRCCYMGIMFAKTESPAMRWLINIFLLSLNALYIWSLVRFPDWYEQNYLFGPGIIAALFLGLFSLAINVQLNQDFLNKKPSSWLALRFFAHYFGQFLFLVLAVMGGLAFIVRGSFAMGRFLPGFEMIIGILVFVSYIGLLIRFIKWLTEKNLWRSPHDNQ
jgi:hypothetical protein